MARTWEGCAGRGRCPGSCAFRLEACAQGCRAPQAGPGSPCGRRAGSGPAGQHRPRHRTGGCSRCALGAPTGAGEGRPSGPAPASCWAASIRGSPVAGSSWPLGHKPEPLGHPRARGPTEPQPSSAQGWPLSRSPGEPVIHGHRASHRTLGGVERHPLVTPQPRGAAVLHAPPVPARGLAGLPPSAGPACDLVRVQGPLPGSGCWQNSALSCRCGSPLSGWLSTRGHHPKLREAVAPSQPGHSVLQANGPPPPGCGPILAQVLAC